MADYTIHASRSWYNKTKIKDFDLMEELLSGHGPSCRQRHRNSSKSKGSYYTLFSKAIASLL